MTADVIVMGSLDRLRPKRSKPPAYTSLLVNTSPCFHLNLGRGRTSPLSLLGEPGGDKERAHGFACGMESAKKEGKKDKEKKTWRKEEERHMNCTDVDQSGLPVVLRESLFLEDVVLGYVMSTAQLSVSFSVLCFFFFF